MAEPNGFIEKYLDYCADTEVPTFFHRWAAISCIGAALGRNFYFSHGHFTVYPNLYVMLMGTPGTRKSTAIKLVRKLLQESGYEYVAADRTTKEKFLADLAGMDDTSFDGSQSGSGAHKYQKSEDSIDTLSTLLDLDEEDVTLRPPAECYITADEFNDFMGTGNLEFASMLGSFWDYEGVYTSRVKNSKSIAINNPTISILGGNTPTGFSMAFPPEVIGQGFLSRVLLVHGEPNGRKIAFPEQPSKELRAELVTYLQRIRLTLAGEAEVGKEAKDLLIQIYNTWPALDDYRFAHYHNRRFNQLLKLCLISAASHLRQEITCDDVIYANTILAQTEHMMPKALGEFGNSKNSALSHKVIETLELHVAAEGKAMKLPEIFEKVSTDVSSNKELQEVVAALLAAKKIMWDKGSKGYIPVRKVIQHKDEALVDWSILTAEERSGHYDPDD